MKIKELCEEVFIGANYYAWDYYNISQNHSFKDIWENSKLFVENKLLLIKFALEYNFNEPPFSNETLSPNTKP